MSNNLLGKDENLNAVQPNFVTGGESLSELLSNPKCPLRTLNVSASSNFSSAVIKVVGVTAVLSGSTHFWCLIPYSCRAIRNCAQPCVSCLYLVCSHISCLTANILTLTLLL
jgi:hypothetical protein